MIINDKSIVVGSTIARFFTHNPYDTTQHYGKVEGIHTYRTASGIMDVVSYHQQVLAAKPEQAFLPLEQQQFLVIQDLDNVLRAFAVEWINTPTFDVVAVGSNAYVKVYNLSDTDAIASMLQTLIEAGYSAKLVRRTEAVG